MAGIARGLAGIGRGLAVLVAGLATALVWAAPGLAPPASAQATAEVAEEVVEHEFDGCTFRLVNRYDPEAGTQYALTRQVRTDDCRFGARNRTIRVQVCFEGPGDAPVDCSPWVRPTAESPFADSEITSSVPRGSRHNVDIRGVITSFTLPPPEPAAPPPPPPPAPEPEPPPPPAPAPTTAAPTSTGPATGRQSPASERTAVPTEVGQPQRWQAAPPHRQTRYGLAATLASGGIVLIGLGGTGIWLLRHRPGEG